MAIDQSRVFVIDDEPSVLSGLGDLFECSGYEYKCFTSAEECLCEIDDSIDCVVTDLAMSPVSGIDLIDRLKERSLQVPVVVLTGHADVPTTVLLMQRGAVTVLQKPVVIDQFLDVIARTTKNADERRQRAEERRAAVNRFGRLDADEQAVMRKMVSGVPNKAIACDLLLSTRTLDRRRRTVLETMQVNSVAELAALVERHRLFES
jgi:two-component system, LuxR family, response regulator FixJ